MALLAYLPRFREAARQLSVLESRESWTREQIAAYQLERLNALWAGAIQCVPYYRSLRKERGLPEAFGSLEEYQACVPILSKQTIAPNPQQFLAAGAPAGEWHRTSGSTGAPLRVFRSHRDHREMLRARYRFYSLWGVEIFDRVAWVWTSQQARAPGWKGLFQRTRNQVRDHLRKRLWIPADRLGENDLSAHLRRIEQFRPRGMYGFSRAVHLLASKAEEDGFRCNSLRAVFLTGEAAPAYLVAAVQRAFQAPAVLEYGSVDCGFIAGEWPDHTLRVREDLVILETSPREDGLFDILVTPLTNSAFPMLRYKIGDLSQAPLHYPDRGFAILAGVAGRNDDLLRTSTGSYVHAACIDEVFELEYDAWVRRYRVHQDARGEVTAQIEFARPAPADTLARLEQHLSSILGGQPVHVEAVARIPQTAAGKHRLVTSELRPECESR